ncbi:hypothetical protein AAG570_006831 [Ranatra chinensis]|uniref:Gustatory receptor n=1 Tax=Ranatra chinensis TaxID=642074 RepID=A0ABD0YV75_9HEMI
MASKRRNMFYENKKQETTKIVTQAEDGVLAPKHVPKEQDAGDDGKCLFLQETKRSGAGERMSFKKGSGRMPGGGGISAMAPTRFAQMEMSEATPFHPAHLRHNTSSDHWGMDSETKSAAGIVRAFRPTAILCKMMGVLPLRNLVGGGGQGPDFRWLSADMAWTLAVYAYPSLEYSTIYYLDDDVERMQRRVLYSCLSFWEMVVNVYCNRHVVDLLEKIAEYDERCRRSPIVAQKARSCPYFWLSLMVAAFIAFYSGTRLMAEGEVTGLMFLGVTIRLLSPVAEAIMFLLFSSELQARFESLNASWSSSSLKSVGDVEELRMLHDDLTQCISILSSAFGSPLVTLFAFVCWFTIIILNSFNHVTAYVMSRTLKVVFYILTLLVVVKSSESLVKKSTKIMDEPIRIRNIKFDWRLQYQFITVILSTYVIAVAQLDSNIRKYFAHLISHSG